MAPSEMVQVLLFFGFLIALTPLLGNYMRKVFLGRRVVLTLIGIVINYAVEISEWLLTPWRRAGSA